MQIDIEGVSATTGDYYNLGGDLGWANFTEDQLSNDGHTITISNIDTDANNDISFELGGSVYPVGKTIPAASSYPITLKADTDGEGAKLPSEEQTITLVSTAATSVQTSASATYGFMTNYDSDIVTNYSLEANSTNSFILYYLSTGTFTDSTITITMDDFTFTTNDQISLGYGWVNLTDQQISNDGHTLTISGISTAFDSVFLINVKNKNIPESGSSLVQFVADADGTGTSMLPSEEQTATLIYVALP